MASCFRTRPYVGAVVVAVVLASLCTVMGQPPEEAAVSADGEFFHHDVDATTVAVGARFACALQASDDEDDFGGHAVCWGRDKNGVLKTPEVRTGAQGVQAVMGQCALWCVLPQGLSRTPQESLIQVCASEMFACGITRHGDLTCWGSPDWGQDRAGSYLQVSCGQWHSCAITKVCVVLLVSWCGSDA